MGQVLSRYIADDAEESRAALQRSPPRHSGRSACLCILANALHSRFKRWGVLSDLDEAIELHRAALLLCPPDHSNRLMSLINLSVSLANRFEQRSVLSDLDEAIELNRVALILCPPGHPLRFVSLENHASGLQCRFKQLGILSDFDEAIELYRAALLICPPGHSHRYISLSNLAVSLRDRFQQRAVPSDLDEAIQYHQAALFLCPPGHCHRSMSLNNLAISLRYRFTQRGIPSDLDQAIELNQAALFLRPPAFDADLNNGATRSDLDEAIELNRTARLLCPPDHSCRSMSLNNLASCLGDRFRQRGVPSDLDEAIELHRAALLLCPPGHFDRATSLIHLASDLRDRFEQRGVPSDLDEAIELHRATLLLCPSGHPHRTMSLNNLAISLQDRFVHRGVLSDLSEAIELHRAVILLIPPGHSDQSASLNNLAASLHNRFKHLDVPSDLDEAIELYRAAFLLCRPGHSHRSTSLMNLASCLQDRFQQRSIPSDLDEAIELHRGAVSLYPPGHYHRSGSLSNLAINLHNRFQLRGISSDLDEAIELHRAALFLSSPGDSDQSACLNDLATSLLSRFVQRGVPSDLDDAFRLYLQLSHPSHEISRSDLSAARSWAAFAEELKHSSALVAYQTALKFLDQHVALLPCSSRIFNVIRKAASSLAMDAFSCSLRHGALTTAVELVEQGRAVFWTQSARFRTPLDELSVSGDVGAALAEEFKRLSFRLRNAFDQSAEDQSPQIRQLAIQWDDVVSRIRTLPDFCRFLHPPLFSGLQKAAEDGPVIIVNASQYGCDALIILSARDPVHIPLDIAQTEVSELCSEFQSLADKFGSSDHEYKLVSILRKLWDSIVDPVVQALRLSKVEPGSRIWWCPTAEFTLLPLHAAGPYEKKRDDLSHIYISSYTPTLATLIRARQQISRDVFPQHFVAIGQANPDQGKELLCVTPELAVVAQHLASVASFTSLDDSNATVQGALDALRDNQWLHLACHGMPNRQQPFKSSFAMRDGPLMINDIIRSHWQNPEFAFLSACHTTVGDEMSPDESIHLAAAMQFSGFRSVIGSMWSVDDKVALQVVSAFYSNLVDDSGRLDCRRAAVALHKAVKSLRKKTISLEQRIVFVHIGV
ncbi:TPR-like protein [Suillus ampliporus]|nr:TPR-like protein [Suillus ampliporus]